MLVVTLILASWAPLSLGFSVGTVPQEQSTRMGATTTCLKASRRQVFDSLAKTFVVAGATTAASLLGNPQESTAASSSINEVDFSKVQDLLGNSDVSYSPSAPAAGKRPTYLTEPTSEFKENEAKAAEFRRANLKQKAEFKALIEAFETSPDTEDALASAMDGMRRFVKKYNGLPEGITKKEVITLIRRRKAKKFWPTNCEISYQDLLTEIMYQQSPNTEKDSENPL